MKFNNTVSLASIILSLLFTNLLAQKKSEVPSVYSNIYQDEEGKFFIYTGKDTIYEFIDEPWLKLENLKGDPKGKPIGLFFDFKNEELNGTLYYGFIPLGDSQHPLPVYFRQTASIMSGRTTIPIKGIMGGKYDMIGWEQSGKGKIGYRIVDDEGRMLYDGRISFKGKGPFKIDDSVIEGPFVNLVTDEGATISFETNNEIIASVEVGGKTFSDEKATKNHEILISGLESGKDFDYNIVYGDNREAYTLHTAPKPGSKTKFTFAYASDSRSGNGGGERDLYGANFYIMKKIMALSKYRDVKFFQFSGDMINGYLRDPDEARLQYANWKRAVEPFWHHFPVYISMGNHEALLREFRQGGGGRASVDRFPFETESAEAIFNEAFVNPTNGPESEDGASYDPSSKNVDFPSYKENVFYYTYDNVAVIVLNSNYLYNPSAGSIPLTGGGLHAYIMDQQLKWLRSTIKILEKDENIDHVFLTQHTPCFPNGGHVRDDMWYGGDNQYRPVIAGKPLAKGIIERRDEYLDIIINKSSKVRAIMTGDEHNYAKTEIKAGMEIYPENWEGRKIKISRTIYQINNGAAGAPYYAQEQTPWTPNVTGFTTQHALVLFHVNGEEINMEVINPDTLEPVDELKLN